MRRRLFVLLVLAFLSVWSPSVYAQTFCAGDTTGVFTVGALSLSETFNAQASCGASNYVLVSIVIGDTATDDSTGCTYNSVAMTLVNKVLSTGGRWEYAFRLLGPASGSNSVTCTFSSSHVIELTSASWSGVTVIGNNITNSASASTSLTTSLSASANNTLMVLDGWAGSGINTGTGSTRRAFETGGGAAAIYESSGGVVSSGTNVSMTFTTSSSSPDSAVMFELQAGGGGGGCIRRPALVLLGVGICGG